MTGVNLGIITVCLPKSISHQYDHHCVHICSYYIIIIVFLLSYNCIICLLWVSTFLIDMHSKYFKC